MLNKFTKKYKADCWSFFGYYTTTFSKYMQSDIQKTQHYRDLRKGTEKHQQFVEKYNIVLGLKNPYISAFNRTGIFKELLQMVWFGLLRIAP